MKTINSPVRNVPYDDALRLNGSSKQKTIATAKQIARKLDRARLNAWFTKKVTQYHLDMSDHTFSVYVNRPGLSFGYFFRGGGTLSGIQRGIVEFTVEGYNERAFISMNQQQVQQLEIDDGNTIQVVDIDRNKPFAIVLPINAGNITFYDVNRNTVEYWNNPL